jgi:CHAT domain-containing protein
MMRIIFFLCLISGLACNHHQKKLPFDIPSQLEKDIFAADKMIDQDRHESATMFRALLDHPLEDQAYNFVYFKMRLIQQIQREFGGRVDEAQYLYRPSQDSLSLFILQLENIMGGTFLEGPWKLDLIIQTAEKYKDFPIFYTNIHYVLGLYFKYHDPTDIKAIDHFNTSIESAKLSLQSCFVGIMSCREGIQNALNEREFITASSMGDNAYSLAHKSDGDSLALCLGYMSKAYGRSIDDDMPSCLRWLDTAQNYGLRIGAEFARQEALKYISYYNYGRDSLAFVKYLDMLKENIKQYGDHINLQRTLAYYDLQEGRYDESLTKYQKALHFYHDSTRIDPLNRIDPADIQTIHIFMSEACKKTNRIDQALDYLLVVYNLTDPRLRNFEYLYENINDALVGKNATMNYILGNDVAQILLQKYKIDHSIKTLEKALDFMEVSLLATFNPLSTAADAKEMIIFDEYARYYLSNTIPMIYELYSRTKDRTYLEKYNSLVAASRARVTDANDMDLSKQFKVDKVLITREKYLNGRLSMLKVHKHYGHDSLRIWVDQLKSIFSEYQSKYPSYLVERQKRRISSIEYIQTKLNQNEVVIQYDIVNDNVYLFCITKDRVILNRKSYLSSDVDKIYQYQSATSPIDTGYTNLSQKMYQALIPKELSHAKLIYIVPDDVLHQISYDALILPKTNDYAIQRHQFVHLVNIHHISKPNQSKSGQHTSIFAFSDPNTIADRSKKHFVELPGTYKEALFIKKQVPNAQIFLGKAAKKSSFIHQYSSSQTQHMHVAMHGYADQQFENLAYLLFRKHNLSSLDTLYTYEIEQMHSSCQTVVLSACQTHHGKIKTQEGAMTLTRSFIINGANQVISTLWPADDRSTARMMEDIYISGNNILPSAVHKAKLKMIASKKYSVDQWAGLVVVR